MTGDRPGYRAQGGLAAIVRWLLWANAAGVVIEIGFGWSRGFDPLLVGEAELASAWAQLGLFVATAIAFLVWLYRAEVNVRALGAEDMMVSPGWAVGWFFVPFASLVMPFIAVRELWQASARPRDWQLAPSTPAVPLWWACWLVLTISGNAAFLLSRQEEWELYVAAGFMGTVSAVFTIPSAILLAWIVGRLQTMQENPARLADHFA